MKHDAHVRTAFMHFFPTTVFLLALTLFFMLGFYFGVGYQFIFLH